MRNLLLSPASVRTADLTLWGRPLTDGVHAARAVSATITGAGTAAKAAGASAAPVIPASTLEGDLLVAWVAAEGSGMSSGSATGWDLINQGEFLNLHYNGMFCRVATASDETNAGSGTHTFTVNGTPSNTAACVIAVKRASMCGTYNGTLANATSIGIPTLTLAGDNRLVLLMVSSSIDTTLTFPGTFTQVAGTSTGGVGFSCAIAARAYTEPVATGTLTVTAGGTGVMWGSVLQIEPKE